MLKRGKIPFSKLIYMRKIIGKNMLTLVSDLVRGHLLTVPLPKTKFTPQSEGAGHKSRARCLQDLFSQWVIPTEAWPILNEMAVGQQIPAGLHCIIQLFWTHAPAVSELAAAIELLLPPVCTQRIERLLQPCPQCLSSILPWANWAQEPRQCFSSISTSRRTYAKMTYGRTEHAT